MVVATPRHRYTYAEYLALEAESPTRHEYFDGEIYAMAGGTPDHAAIAATLLRLLGNILPPTCQAFTSDLRVRIESTGLTTYPDAAVVCGKSNRAELDSLAVTNPVLLAEVTSPSTESYDRNEKLQHYQTIATLREVLIVAHDRPHVTHWVRTGTGGWETREYTSGESVSLRCVPGHLSIDDLYRRPLEDG